MDRHQPVCLGLFHIFFPLRLWSGHGDASQSPTPTLHVASLSSRFSKPLSPKATRKEMDPGCSGFGEMADEGCVGRRVPGAAGAGAEAEEERAGRGRRQLWVWAWLQEMEAGCRWAKRLWVAGRWSVAGSHLWG